jgi:hypothetical protein
MGLENNGLYVDFEGTARPACASMAQPARARRGAAGRMSRPPRQTAAGVLVAGSVVAGVAVGVATRQPSIGFVAGLAVGAVLAAISMTVLR